MSSHALREEFLELVRRDLLGPAGGEREVITEANVRDRYLLGMLAPLQQSDEPTREQFDELAEDGDDSPEEGSPEPATPAARGLMPSSFGMSFSLDPTAKSFVVEAHWGQYLRDKDAAGDSVWVRHPRGSASEPVVLREGTFGPWRPDRECPRVLVRGKIRKRDHHWSVTLFLCNEQEEERPKDPTWLFQAELKVKGDLIRQTARAALACLDPASRMEDLVNEMLYRRQLGFAMGHGISANWKLAEGSWDRAVEAFTSAMPRETVLGVEPASVKNLVVDMQVLASASDADLSGLLQPIVGSYRNDWIEELNRRRQQEPDLQEYADASKEAVRQAEDALRRMEEGLALLESSGMARDAFRFTNQAMAWQRVRGEWIKQKRTNPQLTLEEVDIPRNRSWRAFQLAFLLLNLPGVTHVDHPDRSTRHDAVADLLWFPTGGGKTEAYLGLAAYTLAIRRLQPGLGGRDGENGMAVMMRYTLRLLTLQQFQRASSLMCACEVIRRGDEKKWGRTPFRLGLWVGRKTTPNTTAQAQTVVEALRSGQRPPAGVGSPHQITTCPWCGTEIKGGEHIRVELYPSGRARTIITCGDKLGRCEFSRAKAPDEGLPVVVVDEEIYRRPPSMLIATVDKFAQMAWTGEVQTLFGEVTGHCPRHGFRSPELQDADMHQAAAGNLAVRTEMCPKLRPPDLIIQDELHLISGPLGSLVGIYEGAIDNLATWEVDGVKVRPKVVASTATVRRAQGQVNALFMRDVRVFPPPGLEAGHNFFSREVEEGEKSPGRLYVGICAPGRRLKAALIRVYVAVLAAGQTMYEKHGDSVDSFLTAVGYFSSLRELGGMRRLVDDDVRSRLTQIAARGLRPRRLMLPDAVEELTSRVSAVDIPKLLEKMYRRFPPFGQHAPAGQRPVDVLLATNMLSVGIDVGRLGLMVVAGQPKSTSEYIQATSRVGRDSAGIVFTVYNWSRPRDLSHFETFRNYHATFYRHVEALSVTPYSAGALERALTGVLVSALRQGSQDLNPNLGAGLLTETHPMLARAREAIAHRAGMAGSRASLEQDVRSAVQSRIDLWMDRVRRRPGGVRLGYETAPDGTTVGLLRQPGVSGWTEFTVLNSLRDVEPEVPLVFNDAGMDVAGGIE
ncbi:MAG: DISARM system helicase DrmA [Bryobacteraceae bacterium]